MGDWNFLSFLLLQTQSEGFSDNYIVPGLQSVLLLLATAHNIFLTSLHMWQCSIMVRVPFKPKMGTIIMHSFCITVTQLFCLNRSNFHFIY